MRADETRSPISPLVVVVFGSPGAGKSEAIAALARHRRARNAQPVVAIVEPTERLLASGALSSMYTDARSGAYDAQMLMLAERTATYWTNTPTIECASTRPWVLLDGHLALDVLIYSRVHRARGTMSEEQLLEWAAAYERASKNTPRWSRDVFMFVYLRPGARECQRRAQQLRARDVESTLVERDFVIFDKACEAAAAQLREDDRVLVTIDSSRLTIDATAERIERAILDACTSTHFS